MIGVYIKKKKLSGSCLIWYFKKKNMESSCGYGYNDAILTKMCGEECRKVSEKKRVLI